MLSVGRLRVMLTTSTTFLNGITLSKQGSDVLVVQTKKKESDSIVDVD